MGVLGIKGSDRILYTIGDRTLSAYTAPKVQEKLSSIYYTPKGYWRGLAAIKKLATDAKVSETVARDWLKRQAIWQIYLPATRHIPRLMFDEDSPNAVHEADLLYLPHDRVDRRTYKFALTVVDVASRYIEAEPLTDKSATEVAAALGCIYKRGPLTWHRLLQVDPGRDFMDAFSQLQAKHNVQVRRGAADNHRQQGIVERLTGPWQSDYSDTIRRCCLLHVGLPKDLSNG